tara:strand:+ start:2590 stop:3828 length:1239 start_codon:yes stop_codon:yes gene_type:complete
LILKIKFFFIMNYLFKSFIFCYLLFSFNIYSQSEKVIAGPMVSFIDAYGTQIWFLLSKSAKKIEFDIKDYDKDKLWEYDFEVDSKNIKEEFFPYTVKLEKLLPNKEYIATVYVDGEFVKEIDIFTKRPHLDDVQFLIGSNLKNPSATMLSNMRKTNSDFMVWLGGHVNLDKSNSYDEIISKYVDARKNTVLNNFLTSTPQIATWNDHDFNYKNNLTGDLMVDSSYFAFNAFWPNSLQKTYNYTYFDYGTYQRYTYNDVDIFLLDACSFRSENNLYGDKQIERLFQELNNTGSTFTIIASPIPFTEKNNELDFSDFKTQYDYFLYRLKMSENNGCILLSSSENKNVGTKLLELEIHDDVKNINFNEFNISHLSNNNYSLVSIKGSKGNRKLTFETYNENGNILFSKTLHENEL